MMVLNLDEGVPVEREDIVSKRLAWNDADKLGTHCV